ncbi:hypothetical protein [Methylobacterium iners]|uniref:Transcription factor zinc-finger domain-containing protein n=1 Tax=Methylobacterium iners TaxID=418707 RepID=A0ABQ4RZC3_9HYPH|nr:hypothetical protein [Methylobacterium iners]GJD96041.1 hypothetical protein OCOJLMKI_3259 [Methylobacterium iners]
MAEWYDQGCEACRAGILAGSPTTPLPLAVSLEAHAQLRRCDLCEAWWIENEREAHVISGDEARVGFPKHFRQHPNAPA